MSKLHKGSIKRFLKQLITEKKKVWIGPSFNPSYKKGLLDKALGIPENERIPYYKLDDFINKLRKKAKGDSKLSEKESYLLKRAVMVRTLKRIKEKGGFNRKKKKFKNKK